MKLHPYSTPDGIFYILVIPTLRLQLKPKLIIIIPADRQWIWISWARGEGLSHSATVQSWQMLQSQDLRVGQVKKPCIRLTQENLIENSVQDCLPYIQIPNGPCKLFLAYPKWPCVCLKVNMYITYCMTSSFQNLLCPSMCYVTCDHVIWCDLLCDSVILSH